MPYVCPEMQSGHDGSATATVTTSCSTASTTAQLPELLQGQAPPHLVIAHEMLAHQATSKTCGPPHHHLQSGAGRSACGHHSSTRSANGCAQHLAIAAGAFDSLLSSSPDTASLLLPWCCQVLARQCRASEVVRCLKSGRCGLQAVQ
jgi:hypothetical protein